MIGSAVLALMTISVVIPCYNRAHLVGDAIRSALAQTVQPSEIIVVDDGSKDGSEAIASGFSGVRCLRQTNAGPSAARNAGIQAATGDWVAFLDSDDLWPPTRLSSQLALLEAHPDLVFIFGREAKFSVGCTPVKVNDGHAQPTGRLADPFGQMMRDVNIPTSGVLVRRDALLAAGGFDNSLRLCEDCDLWMRLALAGHKFGVVDEIHSLRRMHDGNLVNEKLRFKEAAAVVFARYADAQDDARAIAHRKLSSLHYDLGSAFLKQRKFSKAKAHLGKVRGATGLRRLVLMAKRAAVVFA